MNSFLPNIKKTYLPLCFIFLFTFLSIFTLNAQTFTMGVHRHVIACNGTIYDNGGVNGNYGSGRNDTMTITSNNITNRAIQITFMEQYDINEHDTLYFYNGSEAHPDSLTFSIGSTGGSWVNNSTTVSFIGTDPPSVIAFIPGSGSITLRFKTSGGTITLPVTINPIPTTFVTKNFTLYDVQLPFHYGDSTFNAAGNYTVWTSCDSAVTINLTVVPTTPNNSGGITGYEEIYICDTTEGVLPYDYSINNIVLHSFTQTETVWINNADTSVVVKFVIDPMYNGYVGSFIEGYTQTCNRNTNTIVTYIHTDLVAEQYAWVSPWGDTILNNDHFIIDTFVTTRPDTLSGYYSVFAVGPGCGYAYSLRDYIGFYFCNDSIFPQEAITGFDDVCSGSTQTYEVLGGFGTTYTWVIEPSSAGTIISGQGTHIITVLWTTTPGNATVSAIPAATTAAGFKLGIACTAPCQPLSVYFDELLTNPPLHFDTTNICGIDGFKYIDACPNASVNFVAYGDYPFAGYSYYQGDDSTTFIWKIGDESYESVGASSITRNFNGGRGYNISLKIKDQRGCTSNNAATARLRTSKNPLKQINFTPVCVDSTTSISVGYNASSFLQIEPVQDAQVSSLTVTETIFLPDGTNCPPYGYYYRSPVTFTSFSQNATITSADDIRYVRVNMEHSYIGDIRISLQCPSGQKINLLPDYQDTGWPSAGTTSTWMGEASEVQDGGGCNASSNSQGNGWNYCFSNNTDPTLGYVYATSPNKYIYENANVINHNNPFHGSRSTVAKSEIDTIYSTVRDSTICYVMENGVIVDTIIEYTESTLKTPKLRQAYRPTTAFYPGLSGCPLNGTWFIEVQDTWGIDNGYLFEWELSLDPDLLPAEWKYSVAVDTVLWNYNETLLNMTYGNDTTLTIHPLISAAGTYPIRATLVDVYGCDYDTIANLIVNALPNIMINGLHNGQVNTCMGESAELIATNGAYYLWNNQSNNDTLIVNSSGVYSVIATDVNGCENFDTITVIIHDAPAAELEGSTEECHPLLEIIPQAPIFCTSILETGYDIWNENGTQIANNLQTTLFPITSITEEGDYSFKVVSRYDDIHIPVVGDILCSDGTYVSPTNYASSGKTASGVLFWVNNGSIPGVTDDYWIVGLTHINRTRIWGYDTLDYPIPNFTAATAITDYADKINTDTIKTYTVDINNYTVANCAASCRSYATATANIIPIGSYWNVPAVGQLPVLKSVLPIINSSLAAVGAAQISTSEIIWSSTEESTTHAFAYNLGTDTPISTNKSIQYKTRPITETPLVKNLSDTAYITIQFRKPIAQATATDLVVPIGGSTTLTAEDIKVYDPVECAPTSYSYAWRDPSNTVISNNQILQLDNLTIAGNYTYTVTIIPLNGCSNGCSVTTSITISVRNIPLITGDQIVCFNDTRTYSTSLGKQNYSWRFNNNLGTIVGGSISSESITIEWDINSGTETIYLSYEEDNIPTDTAAYPVTIKPLPDEAINLGGDGSFCEGDPGRVVTIVNPEIGIYYMLFRNSSPASSIAITSSDGSAINFPIQSSAGTYTVKAYTDNLYNDDTCEIWLDDNVILEITPNPPARPINH